MGVLMLSWGRCAAGRWWEGENESKHQPGAFHSSFYSSCTTPAIEAFLRQHFHLTLHWLNLIQLYGDFGGCSLRCYWTVLCYIDRYLDYFVHPINNNEVRLKAEKKPSIKLNQHLSKIISTKTEHDDLNESQIYCRTVVLDWFLARCT